MRVAYGAHDINVVGSKPNKQRWESGVRCTPYDLRSRRIRIDLYTRTHGPLDVSVFMITARKQRKTHGASRARACIIVTRYGVETFVFIIPVNRRIVDRTLPIDYLTARDGLPTQTTE